MPIDWVGTDFQQCVWRILQTIPYGDPHSYAEQAVNGQNKISIIVPCHRVIGKNGKLMGYAGGLARKQFLLNREK